MRRNFTPTLKRLSILVCFMITQVDGWAAETSSGVHHAGSFFMQPWPWILLIVAAIILLAGPFNYEKDFTVTMKKKSSFD